MNSGIADVHNLAWKIAAVHQGWATDSLLDTYESDRQQVALVNAQQSVKNGEKIFSFLKSLGATVSDVTKARQNLLDTVNDPAQAGLVAAHIEGQREHFDNVSQTTRLLRPLFHVSQLNHTARPPHWLCLRPQNHPQKCLGVHTRVRTRGSSTPCLDSTAPSCRRDKSAH